MSELIAEVVVVVHAHDRPAAVMDRGELVILPTGSSDIRVVIDPPDAEHWMRLLSSSVTDALNISRDYPEEDPE